MFGIGPGGLRSDTEMMGNLDRDRNAMFVESINQIRDRVARIRGMKMEGMIVSLDAESAWLDVGGKRMRVPRTQLEPARLPCWQQQGLRLLRFQRAPGCPAA